MLIVDPAAMSGVTLLIYSFALAAAVWAAVAVIAAREGWHVARRPRPSVSRAA